MTFSFGYGGSGVSVRLDGKLVDRLTMGVDIGSVGNASIVGRDVSIDVAVGVGPAGVDGEDVGIAS